MTKVLIRGLVPTGWFLDQPEMGSQQASLLSPDSESGLIRGHTHPIPCRRFLPWEFSRLRIWVL